MHAVPWGDSVRAPTVSATSTKLTSAPLCALASTAFPTSRGSGKRCALHHHGAPSSLLQLFVPSQSIRFHALVLKHFATKLEPLIVYGALFA
eukprot:5846152-Amphidinium_carterae.1